MSGMGGGLKEDQLAKELKSLGLKWGQLTSGQVRRSEKEGFV